MDNFSISKRIFLLLFLFDRKYLKNKLIKFNYLLIL